MAGSIYTDPKAAAGHSQDSSSENILQKAWDWLKDDTGQTVASIVGGGLATMFGQNDIDPTGYQGKIPNYQYNRQKLDMPNDPNRRPGSAGRRYFTDGTYSGGSQGDGMPAPAINRNPNQTQGIASVPANSGGQPINDLSLQQQQLYKGGMPRSRYASGGIATLKEGRYLRGKTDGMSDEIDTKIDNKDPAALSHGEFVIPADVVSHLGNGNSEAGAKVLQEMMSRIRKERTGKKEQGKEIDPERMMPR